MSVDPDSGEPVYRQLARILRGKLDAGEYTSRLPSIKTLGQEYGLSHVSVEKALKVLADEGRIYGVVGKGFYVGQPPA